MDDGHAQDQTCAAVERQVPTSQQVLAHAHALLADGDARRQHRRVVTFLMQTIQRIQPGQEEHLDALERDLDDWLTRKQLGHLRAWLHRHLPAQRARLAVSGRPLATVWPVGGAGK